VGARNSHTGRTDPPGSGHRLYNRLNHWIVLRVWNHKHKHWRNAGWRDLPDRRLYGELGLVNLLQLIPSMESYYRQKGLIR